MRTSTLWSVSWLVVFAILCGCRGNEPRMSRPLFMAAAGDTQLSGPYQFKNLTIFLIHGPDTIAGNSYLTLQEALEQKKIIVYETGNVNELAISNDGDEPVFIQSGDIVKGGRQDRTFGTDMIVPPHSGKMPIAAFCVEHGRWTQRGNEESAQFASSGYMVSGGAMKLAANANTHAASQSEVWNNASANAQSISQNIGGSIQSTTSPSSYQLALENDKLKDSLAGYTNEFKPLLDEKKDAIGFAVAVNGKISSADVYGSNVLFRKLWPKLLNSAAVEAVMAPVTKESAVVNAEDVRQFMAGVEQAAAERKKINDLTEATTYDAKDATMVQTTDARPIGVGGGRGGGGGGGAAVRRSYIAKPGK